MRCWRTVSISDRAPHHARASRIVRRSSRREPHRSAHHVALPETALAAPDGGEAVFVRPHDLELVRRQSGIDGEPGLVLSIHAAGARACLTCERNSDGEHIEVELSRAEYDQRQVRPDDAVLLRIRHSRTLREEHAI